MLEAGPVTEDIASPSGPRLRVLMFPKEGDNPYLRSLSEGLDRLGVRVDDFTFMRALTHRYDVLHIHWPDLHLQARSSLRAAVKHARLALLLLFLRSRGTRVVWTVHNLKPHERHPPVGEWLFPRWFPRLCTHVVALTASSLASAIDKYPALRRARCAVIPHGHYRDAYPKAPPRSACRDQLGLDHRFTFLFLGNIRPYKNVPLLIQAFRALPRQDVQLIIAGEPGHMMNTDEIRELVGHDPRIHLSLGFISDEEVPLYVGACDVMVLPFQTILNSGSVFLALSFNRAVLAPNLGSLPEIQSNLGERWVKLYSGPLATEHLLQAMSSVSVDENEIIDLCSYDWHIIAQRTLELYLAPGRSDGRHGAAVDDVLHP